MNKALKIGKKVLNGFCWMFVALLVVTMIISLTSKVNGGTPSFFGYSIYRVSSPSMEPELKVGDVILSKEIENPLTIKIDDVITFEGEYELAGLLVTHKVIKAPYTDNGVTKVQTQGVANEMPDTPFSIENVRGMMICKIPVLDVFYNLFFSPWGLIIIIGLLIFIFIDEIITIVRILSGHERTADDGEDINEIIERLQNEKNKDDSVENTAEN